MKGAGAEHLDAALVFETDLGWILLTWRAGGLRLLRLFGPERPAMPPAEAPAWVRGAIVQLQRHLGSQTAELASIPLDLGGQSPFARRVLEALRRTRSGETLTYGQLARLAGTPGAARAVGQVMARNPLPILIPCHRVVAATGPGGFSLFGSLATKAKLLALEAY